MTFWSLHGDVATSPQDFPRPDSYEDLFAQARGVVLGEVIDVQDGPVEPANTAEEAAAIGHQLDAHYTKLTIRVDAAAGKWTTDTVDLLLYRGLGAVTADQVKQFDFSGQYLFLLTPSANNDGTPSCFRTTLCVLDLGKPAGTTINPQYLSTFLNWTDPENSTLAASDLLDKLAPTVGTEKNPFAWGEGN
ncbi:hypothetical protein D1871_22555 [Nakamurella silvestris]|nr:hypothetical protein D1871_22555 [Nakamurella silvestris]